MYFNLQKKIKHPSFILLLIGYHLTLTHKTIELVKRAIEQHYLPNEFIDTVKYYYFPLSQSIAQSVRTGSTSFIGIQGSQGSGKSTCAAFLKLLLESEYQLRTVVASIDDFYLTRLERQELSQKLHPLFETRGVPSTHDIKLIHSVLNKAKAGLDFDVPVFDKANDDRAPVSQWQKVTNSIDIFILEGWCVGIKPQLSDALITPINSLERIEDSNMIWRSAVNMALSNYYAELFEELDLLISLQAPSFDCVLGWRQLQEEKMIAKLEASEKSTARALTPQQIENFISYFQRLTEHALRTMPSLADYVLFLNEYHQFTSLETNKR